MQVQPYLMDVFNDIDTICKSVYRHSFSGAYKFGTNIPFGTAFVGREGVRDVFAFPDHIKRRYFNLTLNTQMPRFYFSAKGDRMTITENTIVLNSTVIDVPETEEDYFNLTLLHKLPLSLDEIQYIKSKICKKDTVPYLSNMLIGLSLPEL